ncbi:hypothetical protein [Nesterenkonia pannonica]|uniref:hypothetical protein n=1 Tax=Nesterenkonia pannonica TaxID=1548602 RepID=UPI002164830F|nr:hypothetical protein [Nesterenkonia pannonica]
MTIEEELAEERRIINAAVVDGPLDSRDAGESSIGGARVYEPSGYPLPGCFNCGENDAVYEAGDAERIAHSWNALPLRNAQLQAVLVTMDEFDAEYPDGGTAAVQRLRRAIEDAAP